MKLNMTSTSSPAGPGTGLFAEETLSASLGESKWPVACDPQRIPQQNATALRVSPWIVRRHAAVIAYYMASVYLFHGLVVWLANPEIRGVRNRHLVSWPLNFLTCEEC